MDAIKLPSGRTAFLQTTEDSFSIYGPDGTTFIAVISVEDARAIFENYNAYKFTQSVNNLTSKQHE